MKNMNIFNLQFQCNQVSEYNHFCKKCINDYDEKMKKFLSFLLEHRHEIHECPYGYSSYCGDHNIYCGFWVEGFANSKKILGHDRQYGIRKQYTVFTEEDFLYWIKLKENETDLNSSEKLNRLKKYNI